MSSVRQTFEHLLDARSQKTYFEHKLILIVLVPNSLIRSTLYKGTGTDTKFEYEA